MTSNEIRMEELRGLMEEEYYRYAKAEDAGRVRTARNHYRRYLVYLAELNRIATVEEHVLKALNRGCNN